MQSFDLSRNPCKCAHGIAAPPILHDRLSLTPQAIAWCFNPTPSHAWPQHAHHRLSPYLPIPVQAQECHAGDAGSLHAPSKHGSICLSGPPYHQCLAAHHHWVLPKLIRMLSSHATCIPCLPAKLPLETLHALRSLYVLPLHASQAILACLWMMQTTHAPLCKHIVQVQACSAPLHTHCAGCSSCASLGLHLGLGAIVQPWPDLSNRARATRRASTHALDEHPKPPGPERESEILIRGIAEIILTLLKLVRHGLKRPEMVEFSWRPRNILACPGNRKIPDPAVGSPATPLARSAELGRLEALCKLLQDVWLPKLRIGKLAQIDRTGSLQALRPFQPARARPAASCDNFTDNFCPESSSNLRLREQALARYKLEEAC